MKKLNLNVNSSGLEFFIVEDATIVPGKSFKHKRQGQEKLETQIEEVAYILDP